MADIPGAWEHGLPIKPLDRFLARLGEKEAQLPEGAPVVVAGGGAGGSELALALAHRLRAIRPKVTLATDTDDVLLTHSEPVRARMRAALAEAGVTVRTSATTVAVLPEQVALQDGTALPSTLTVLATGGAPVPWLAGSGLAVDARGFLAVGEALASTSHPDVFASGDIAAFTPRPLPKAGVYAVRQGPVLAKNLRLAAQGKALTPFQPQQRFLSLLSCGGRRAIASYGPLALSGPVSYTHLTLPTRS